MQFSFPGPGTSDVIRCVSFDCFTLSQCISYKGSTHWAVFSAVLSSGKCPQMMNYPVTHHLRVMLSRCRRGSFNSIVQCYRVGSWKKETWRRKTRTTKMVYVCDLRMSIWKQGNSLELVNYKYAMPSMQTSSFNQTHVLVASNNISLSYMEGRIYIITLLNPLQVLIIL